MERGRGTVKCVEDVGGWVSERWSLDIRTRIANDTGYIFSVSGRFMFYLPMVSSAELMCSTRQPVCVTCTSLRSCSASYPTLPNVSSLHDISRRRLSRVFPRDGGSFKTAQSAEAARS